MAISFQCAECGSRFAVDDRSAGKRVKCKKCGNIFTVPLGGPGISEAYDVDGVPETPQGESSAAAHPPMIPVGPLPRQPLAPASQDSNAADAVPSSIFASWKLWLPVGLVAVAVG